MHRSEVVDFLVHMRFECVILDALVERLLKGTTTDGTEPSSTRSAMACDRNTPGSA
jgi:hypothetical protein